MRNKDRDERRFQIDGNAILHHARLQKSYLEPVVSGIAVGSQSEDMKILLPNPRYLPKSKHGLLKMPSRHHQDASSAEVTSSTNEIKIMKL